MGVMKTRSIQSITIACLLVLASLALAFEAVSARTGPEAIGATVAHAPPISAMESGLAFPLQQAAPDLDAGPDQPADE